MTQTRTDNPEEEDVLRKAMRGQVAMIHTAVPGRVIEYDAAEQRARVQPIVRFRRFVDNELVTYIPKPISGVPVKFFVAGGKSITAPIPEGTQGMIFFAERSMDEWLATGDVDNEPADVRRHDIKDAFFDPGVKPFVDALPASAIDPDHMVIATDTEILLGSSAATLWVALANKVLTQLNNLENAFNSHIHVTTATISSGPPGVLSPTGAPVVPSVLNDVKSDKVRSE